jgi:hypothetical protein
MELGFGTEMEKETQFDSSSSQVAEELAMACGGKIMRGLHFDDQFPIHDQVEPLQPDHLVLEVDGYLYFSFHRVAKSPESSNERLDVDRLQKAVSKLIVDEVEGSDHRLAQLRVEELLTAFGCHGPQDPGDPVDPRYQTVSTRTVLFPD